MKQIGLLAALFFITTAAFADDAPLRIVARDGQFTPQNIAVAADKPFLLEVSNEGDRAIEFESKTLRVETVVAPGKTVAVPMRALRAGKYRFYDEYNDSAFGYVVVK